MDLSLNGLVSNLEVISITMKINQIRALQAIGIPIWVSQGRELPKDKSRPSYFCLIDKKEGQQPNLRALFESIIRALQWTGEDYELCLYESGIAKIRPEQYQACIIFGRQFKPSFPCIQVASLKEMVQSTQAKRATWQKLKPLVKV